jgi:hypothetical protein
MDSLRSGPTYEDAADKRTLTVREAITAQSAFR